jgi:hypothetical protein
MRRVTVTTSLLIALISAGCASSSASNCAEYASEVRFQMEHADTAEDLMGWLQDTSEHAAKLIQADPARADSCATAILEATFSAGFAELEAEIDVLLDQ